VGIDWVLGLGFGMWNVEVNLTITLCVTVVSFLLCSSFTGSISLSVMVFLISKLKWRWVLDFRSFVLISMRF
jgi:hypothetical protein